MKMPVKIFKLDGRFSLAIVKTVSGKIDSIVIEDNSVDGNTYAIVLNGVNVFERKFSIVYCPGIPGILQIIDHVFICVRRNAILVEHFVWRIDKKKLYFNSLFRKLQKRQRPQKDQTG